MRTAIVSIAGLVALTVAVHAQTPAKPTTSEPLTWRLLPPEQPYAAIDGRNLKDLVDDQTAMSRRYRDSGQTPKTRGGCWKNSASWGFPTCASKPSTCRRNGCRNPGA
jgi:hypothetical protein